MIHGGTRGQQRVDHSGVALFDRSNQCRLAALQWPWNRQQDKELLNGLQQARVKHENKMHYSAVKAIQDTHLFRMIHGGARLQQRVDHRIVAVMGCTDQRRSAVLQ